MVCSVLSIEYLISTPLPLHPPEITSLEENHQINAKCPSITVHV